MTNCYRDIIGATGGAFGGFNSASSARAGIESSLDFFNLSLEPGMASWGKILTTSLLPASFYLEPIACDEDESFDTDTMSCVPAQISFSINP